MSPEVARRALRILAAVGAVPSVAFLARALTSPDWRHLAQAMLVVGAAVVVPLGVALSLPSARRPTPQRSSTDVTSPNVPPRPSESVAVRMRSMAFLVVVIPLGALGAATSLAIAPGVLAASLAALYALSCASVAAFGAVRFAYFGVRVREELAVDVGLVSLAVSGVWLLADRAGLADDPRGFMGFTGPILLMTAVHFVFAGFAAAVVVGVVGRSIAPGTALRRVWAVAALAVCVGPALVAVGITASPAVESVSGTALALGMLLHGTALVVVAARNARAQPGAAALTALSALGLVVSMGMAALFSARAQLAIHAPELVLSWDAMARVHGSINALGFALCSTLGLTFLNAPSRLPSLGIPWSRLRAPGLVVTPELVASFVDSACPVTREIDDIDALNRPGFDASAVDAEVRSFYEDTARFTMRAQPRWRPLFIVGARVWSRIATHIGNLKLPVTAAEGDMTGSFAAVHEELDGRAGDGAPAVRAWIRKERATERPIFIALYALHRDERGVTYMNVAVPLPHSQVTSVLRMDHAGVDGRGLAVTSRGDGDEGVYLVTRWLTVRLPIAETVTLWREHDGLRARHTIHVLGFIACELDYEISRA